MKKHCCLSHEFLRTASNNPNKTAVIHASGGAELFREFHRCSGTLHDAADSFFRECAVSLSPRMYQNDQCFTYSSLLAFVDSLSSRLFSILRGADDPHLIRPTTPRQANSIYSESATPVQKHASRADHLDEQTTYTPKILGVYMSPSVEYIIAVLSILRCGEAFMPLDLSWPKDRILSFLSSSNIELIICSGSAFCENNSNPFDGSHWLLRGSGCSALCFSIKDCPQERVSSSNLVFPCDNGKERMFCYLMYTSGSTGKPKGICGTEQGLLNRFLWMQDIYPLNGEEVLLFKTSITFIDHLQEFLSAILTASTLVIPPMKELRENIYSLVDFIQAYSINKLTAVPSLMRAILPALRSRYDTQCSCSLKFLVLSGEVLPVSLWNALSNLLPETTIFNLYGSTEVAGDCTYFDCKRLSKILEIDRLTTVPIGMPISNCDVVLLSESDAPDEGEIYVSGPCICSGYYSDSTFVRLDDENVPQNLVTCGVLNTCGTRKYIRSGDFARRLPSGDLVFLGRKDRSIKINGQRISLEEIEDILRLHPDVVDAAMIFREDERQLALLEAFLVLKEEECRDDFRSCIRSWMVDKLPLAMMPNHFFFVDSIPVSASGKVDYELLVCSSLVEPVKDKTGDTQKHDLLQVIKRAFCEALMVEEVSSTDDFFVMGGNSLAAAHVSHSLGFDTRLLYSFPSPYKLLTALLEKIDTKDLGKDADHKIVEANAENISSDNFETPYSLNLRQGGASGMKRRSQSMERLSMALFPRNDNHATLFKRMKVETNINVTSEDTNLIAGHLWNSSSISLSCAFNSCNKVMYEGEHIIHNISQEILSLKVPRGGRSALRELWKVHMDSCVDASPLVVFKCPEIYIFIGSHSHKFVCVNAKSGSLQWEIKLEGRVECSAAILGDFSQVVVGSYKGIIYFLEFSTGKICWTFQTSGEVKSRPVVDLERHLVWCGSHDHNLYALDYENYCCIYKLPCGGSLYGSPAIDEIEGKLYVASTSGDLHALSLKASPFTILWQCNLGAPVFGSLAINRLNGNVICCLVDGHVLALDSRGSVIWRCKTDGPIFAGACISSALPSQVLTCSRKGSVYSFELEKGNVLWEYNVGDPITASPYVDEHIQFVSDSSALSDRLVCVCSSSGTIYLLRVNFDVSEETSPLNIAVEEFGRMDLDGDIFSSPLTICGRVFVGCRDDYVHCFEFKKP